MRLHVPAESVMYCAVHEFTGSGLITGSDRIGPDRARNWSNSLFFYYLFCMIMFV